MLRYHVQYVSYTAHVLHVGNLHMMCVRMRIVQYVGHISLPPVQQFSSRIATMYSM